MQSQDEQTNLPPEEFKFGKKTLYTSDQLIGVKSSPSAYQVGSVNFSSRKLVHAHDNSADSENVEGAREPSVHAHFIFRFENGQGNQSLFSTHDQNTAETSQLKRVSHKLSRRTVDAPSTGRFRGASSGPDKLKFSSKRLSRKKVKLHG